MKLGNALLPLCLGLGMAAAAFSASAQVNFHVNANTSNLTAGQTYYAEFTLSDGHVASLGTPDTNNSVLINNFTFGGGMAGAVLPPNIGNASGNFSSGIMLADGDPGGAADLAQGFKPGSAMNFDVHFPTTMVDAGGTPDMFTLKFLNSTTNEFTNSFFDIFVELDLNSPVLTPGNVQTHSGNDPANNALIPAPLITPLGSPPVPELVNVFSLGGLLLAGGSGLWLQRRRLRKSLRSASNG